MREEGEIVEKNRRGLSSEVMISVPIGARKGLQRWTYNRGPTTGQSMQPKAMAASSRAIYVKK